MGRQVGAAALLAGLDQDDDPRVGRAGRGERLEGGDGGEDRVPVVGGAPAVEAIVVAHRLVRAEAVPPRAHAAAACRGGRRRAPCPPARRPPRRRGRRTAARRRAAPASVRVARRPRRPGRARPGGGTSRPAAERPGRGGRRPPSRRHRRGRGTGCGCTRPGSAGSRPPTPGGWPPVALRRWSRRRTYRPGSVRPAPALTPTSWHRIRPSHCPCSTWPRWPTVRRRPRRWPR